MVLKQRYTNQFLGKNVSQSYYLWLVSTADKLDLLRMLLLGAALRDGGGDPGDRLVNASSNGNLQDVREILEANPDKVTL